MIVLFPLAVYCLIDIILWTQFKTRLRPAHFSLNPIHFWSSGRKLVPFLVICMVLMWKFPLLGLAAIVFSKWPHPLYTAFRDLVQKPPTASFPFSKPPKGQKLFELSTTEDQPHILFIVLESFREKNRMSPHFDELAKKGVLFTQFHSTGNLTNRSIVSSLFGVPAPHKPWHLGHFCDLPLIGLPQILAKHGYHPAVIQGASLAFDHEAEFFQKHGFQTILGKRDIDKPGNSWGVYDEYLMPFAADWLEKQKSPTFLYLMTITNHHPWITPDGKQGFSNTLTYTDQALHQLIEELKAKNLLEKSILFIFADHGQELEDRDPHFEINRHLYQDNIHVPLLIYAEGRLQPQKIDTLASQIDLLPTLLDLLNLPDLHQSLGKSLLRPSRSPIYFSHPFDTPIQGCRDGNWKYLIHKDGEELYDLSKDPEEKKNLIQGETALKKQTLDYFESLDLYYSEQKRVKKEVDLHLELTNSFITDEDLKKMALEHPDLVSISLSHCLFITDQGISDLLKHCPKLEKLQLEGLDEITGLNWGEASHLVNFKASHCPHFKIEWIKNLRSLRILHLGAVQIDDDELIALSQIHKNLASIQLKHLYQITHRGLKPLFNANPYLTISVVEDCPQSVEISRASLTQG